MVDVGVLDSRPLLLLSAMGASSCKPNEAKVLAIELDAFSSRGLDMPEREYIAGLLVFIELVLL